MSDDIRELVAGIRDLSSTLIHNNNSLMNTTHNTSNRRHQLSISVLNDIDTFDGKQGHKLDNWLADVENAAAIIEEKQSCSSKRKSERTSTRSHKRARKPTLAPYQRTTSQPSKQCQHTHLHIKIYGNTTERL